MPDAVRVVAIEVVAVVTPEVAAVVAFETVAEVDAETPFGVLIGPVCVEMTDV